MADRIRGLSWGWPLVLLALALLFVVWAFWTISDPDATRPISQLVPVALSFAGF